MQVSYETSKFHCSLIMTASAPMVRPSYNMRRVRRAQLKGSCHNTPCGSGPGPARGAVGGVGYRRVLDDSLPLHATLSEETIYLEAVILTR